MTGVSRRVAALGAAFLAVALLTAGCASFRSSLKQIGSGVHNPPGKTYSVNARVSALSVDTAGNITVTGTGSGHVSVTESVSYSKYAPATTHAVSGSALTLAYTCKTQLICSVDYDIKVPRGMAVHVEGREGTVTLNSLSGPVTAQTVTGMISASGITSPSAVLKSGAGGVNATFAKAPASVQATTTAGTIMIDVPGSDAYKVNADAVVGTTNITVHRSPASPHAITAHSDLGGITISPS